MLKIKKNTVIFFLLVFAVASTGILVGRLSVTSVSAEGEGYEDLKTFTEVLSMVKRH